MSIIINTHMISRNVWRREIRSPYLGTKNCRVIFRIKLGHYFYSIILSKLLRLNLIWSGERPSFSCLWDFSLFNDVNWVMNFSCLSWISLANFSLCDTFQTNRFSLFLLIPTSWFFLSICSIDLISVSVTLHCQSF